MEATGRYGSAPDQTERTSFYYGGHRGISGAILSDDVRKTLSGMMVKVQEDERRAIARELHDEVGQSLTLLNLLLSKALKQPLPESAPTIKEALTVVNRVMAQVRTLSLDLRPRMLDDLGLLPALLWLFDRYTTQTGTAVHFKHSGLQIVVIPPDTASAVYRIIQEALTNAARYSRASSVKVRVLADPMTMRVLVEDRGVGFDPDHLPPGHGMGLTNMRERALSLNGEFSVDSTPGHGTSVTALLPLRDVRNDGYDNHSSAG